MATMNRTAVATTAAAAPAAILAFSLGVVERIGSKGTGRREKVRAR